jgi:fatty acid desaturase
MRQMMPSGRPHFRPVRTEWPTVLLAAVIYGAWLAVTALQERLPIWLLLPAGAWLTAWHMSLQHEVLHGHPTRWRWVNDLIGFPPLSPWLPYARYREQHLGHHRGGNLTDPIDDPESYYVSADALRRYSAARCLLLAACNTFAGRLLLGPLRGMTGFLHQEVARLLAGDARTWRIWIPHLVGVALVLTWLQAVCHMSPLRYFTLFVYPGFALSLIRSFAEHRAASAVDHRTAIVENTPILAMLFLHNNLHVVHHLRPGLAWYRIPRVFRDNRAQLLRLNGGLVYDGYSAVARRYLFVQHDRPDHPFRNDPASAGT